MQELKEKNGEENKKGLSEQQKTEMAAAYKNAARMRNLFIAIAVIVFACVIFYVFSNSKSCTKSAMEVVSGPELVPYLNGIGLSPAVTVEVKNRSGEAIKVRFECVLYDINGNKTATISSGYELIMPGDTVKIVGTTSKSYPYSQYDDNCARISELNYSVLKNV